MACKDCGREIEAGKRCERCALLRRAKIWDKTKGAAKVAGPVLFQFAVLVFTKGKVKPKV